MNLEEIGNWFGQYQESIKKNPAISDRIFFYGTKKYK